jgi:hypothetical protein
MSASQTKPDARTRAEKAFFNVEGEIHDLHHMASIAWTLFQDTLKGASNGTGWRTIQMSEDEYERLEFAVSKTSIMTSALRESFLEDFEKGKKTQ